MTDAPIQPVTIVFWRDIPAQVIVGKGRRGAKVQLSERFEQAIDRVVSSVPGALSDEFSRMLGETRAGASRSDAMRAMDDRCNVPELRSFVMAIIQADQFGVSIGRVLRGQADDNQVADAKIAMTQNLGGTGATSVTHVLGLE